MSNNEALMPCPFCGGEAEKPDYEVSGIRSVSWWVMCSRCSAKAEDSDTEEGAIKAWNTRDPDFYRKVAVEAVRKARRKEVIKDAKCLEDTCCNIGTKHMAKEATKAINKAFDKLKEER